MNTINYTDMDITMERIGDEIECIDNAISEHISRGVSIKDLTPLARLRADLSKQRKDLQGAMDAAECITEVHFNVEECDFDSEITMSGQGIIAVDTLR